MTSTWIVELLREANFVKYNIKDSVQMGLDQKFKNEAKCVHNATKEGQTRKVTMT
jgi:hypothetical protein